MLVSPFISNLSRSAVRLQRKKKVVGGNIKQISKAEREMLTCIACSKHLEVDDDERATPRVKSLTAQVSSIPPSSSSIVRRTWLSRKSGINREVASSKRYPASVDG